MSAKTLWTLWRISVLALCGFFLFLMWFRINLMWSKIEPAGMPWWGWGIANLAFNAGLGAGAVRSRILHQVRRE